MPLKLDTGPTTDAVTYAEAKAWLKLPDDTDQTEVTRLIKMATAQAEAVSGMSLITQTWIQYMDAFPGEIELQRNPVQSITHVKYYDTSGDLQTLTASTDYQSDLVSVPARIKPARETTWPEVYSDYYNAVEVKFVAGYGDAETDLAALYDAERIRTGVLKSVAFSYENHGEGTLLKIPDDVMSEWLSFKVNWG